MPRHPKRTTNKNTAESTMDPSKQQASSPGAQTEATLTVSAVIEKVLARYHDQSKPVMITWASDDDQLPLTEEELLRHKNTFRLRLDFDNPKSPRQEVTVFTNDPKFFERLELFQSGVDFGIDAMKVKPRFEARDAEIVRLKDQEGLTFGQIGRRLMVINSRWVGKDGEPLSRDAVEKAYYRAK